MSGAPRVAFLTDSYHEVNGAARTCRELEAFARRKNHSFCCVRYGNEEYSGQDGSVRILQLKRSSWKFPVDPDLDFDTRFYRYRPLVVETLRDFKPDLVHIISFGDAGILGAIAAAVLKVPLVLSWHTNFHEFASRRVQNSFRWIPAPVRDPLSGKVEDFVLDRVLWYFGRGDVLLAPSPELVELLKTRTGRPTFYMGRGVDTQFFSPDHRERGDDLFNIGFVGRLMPEKNVRFFAAIADKLEAAGHNDFRITMVGHGPERDWLAANVKRVTLTGVLHGEDLGRAYANFDVFAFPSQTDTFGQVVQEAQSSGVPAVVTDKGGPQFLLEHNATGFVARNDGEFIEYLVKLKNDPVLRERMGIHARRTVHLKCWDRIFLEVYKAYNFCKLAGPRRKQNGNQLHLDPIPVRTDSL